MICGAGWEADESTVKLEVFPSGFRHYVVWCRNADAKDRRGKTWAWRQTSYIRKKGCPIKMRPRAADSVFANRLHLAESGLRDCSICGQIKSFSEFGSDRNNRLGLNDHCRPCGTAKRGRLRYYLGQKVGGAKYRAKREGRAFDLDGDYLMHLWSIQGGLCQYSRLPMTHSSGMGPIDTNASIDRINNSIGYTRDNVVLCRWRYNDRKGDLSIWEIFALANGVRRHMGFDQPSVN